MLLCVFVQKIQEQMQSQEASLKTVHELIQQIQALAEEADMSQCHQQVDTIRQDWSDLAQRLTKLKGSLQVSTGFIADGFVLVRGPVFQYSVFPPGTGLLLHEAAQLPYGTDFKHKCSFFLSDPFTYIFSLALFNQYHYLRSGYYFSVSG